AETGLRRFRGPPKESRKIYATVPPSLRIISDGGTFERFPGPGAPSASNQPAGERTRLQNLPNEPNTYGRRHGLRTLQATQIPRVLTVGDQESRPLLSPRFFAKRTHTPKWQKNDPRQNTPNEPSRQDGSFGPQPRLTALRFDPGAGGHPPSDQGSRSAA